MKVWFDIFADESGELIIERHARGWRFEPTGKVGRPPAGPAAAIAAPAAGPQSVLPAGVTLVNWKVSHA